MCLLSSVSAVFHTFAIFGIARRVVSYGSQPESPMPDPEQTKDEVEFRSFLRAAEKRIEGVEEPTEPFDEGYVISVFRDDFPHAVRVAFRGCHSLVPISKAALMRRQCQSASDWSCSTR